MGYNRHLTPRELEIRSENRKYLHPHNKKRCTRCEQVYEGIRENFDIHKYDHKNNKHNFSGQCKACLAQIRADRTTLYKQNIDTYCKKLLPQVRCRAKNEDIPFNLTIDYLVELWDEQGGKCYYTGEPMLLDAILEGKKNAHPDFPSLDKLVPEAGYVPDNIVWCRNKINTIKNNLDFTDFIALCRHIAGR